MFRFTTEMLKKMGLSLKDKMLDLFNLIWESGVVPSRWKEGNVVLLLKRAPSSDIDNYRLSFVLFS